MEEAGAELTCELTAEETVDETADETADEDELLTSLNVVETALETSAASAGTGVSPENGD